MISMTWPQYRRHECMVDGFKVQLTAVQAELLSTLLVRDPEPVLIGDLVGVLRRGDHAPAKMDIYNAMGDLAAKVGRFRVFCERGYGFRLRQAPA